MNKSISILLKKGVSSVSRLGMHSRDAHDLWYNGYTT